MKKRRVSQRMLRERKEIAQRFKEWGVKPASRADIIRYASRLKLLREQARSLEQGK
jgi:hypothetical protein